MYKARSINVMAIYVDERCSAYVIDAILHPVLIMAVIKLTTDDL